LTHKAESRIVKARTRKLLSSSEEHIEAYLDNGVWQGKDGVYALQEGGDRFAESMSGNESTVVGLPMEKLSEVLRDFQAI
jgi:predicted house-cleaning NTP pyrophosphatase (Maf/HAM1 superfamily)